MDVEKSINVVQIFKFPVLLADPKTFWDLLHSLIFWKLLDYIFLHQCDFFFISRCLKITLNFFNSIFYVPHPKIILNTSYSLIYLQCIFPTISNESCLLTFWIHSTPCISETQNLPTLEMFSLFLVFSYACIVYFWRYQQKTIMSFNNNNKWCCC